MVLRRDHLDPYLHGALLGPALVEELAMPSPLGMIPGKEDEALNFRLWAAVLVPPIAGGINVVVGYIVSTYECNVHNRRLVILVSVVCLVLCGLSALLALGTRREIETGRDDPSPSLRSTRLFLRTTGLWFAAGFSLLILAGILSAMLLGACDL